VDYLPGGVLPELELKDAISWPMEADTILSLPTIGKNCRLESLSDDLIVFVALKGEL
jgi:hypothetical protein